MLVAVKLAVAVADFVRDIDAEDVDTDDLVAVTDIIAVLVTEAADQGLNNNRQCRDYNKYKDLV